MPCPSPPGCGVGWVGPPPVGRSIRRRCALVCEVPIAQPEVRRRRCGALSRAADGRSLVEVPHDERHGRHHGGQVGHHCPRQQRRQGCDIPEGRGAQRQSPRLRSAARDQQRPGPPERGLGHGIPLAFRDPHHLGQAHVDRTGRQPVEAGHDEVERDGDLLEQHGIPGRDIPSAAVDDPPRAVLTPHPAVAGIRVVAAHVVGQAGCAGHRSAGPEAGGALSGEHTETSVLQCHVGECVCDRG